MRVSLVLLLPAVLALVAEVSEPQTGAFELAERSNIVDVTKRACNANGCKCDTTKPRKPQGQFCGGCKWSDGSYVITKKRVISHVYECNKNGGCCDYGFAKDCEGDKPGGRCG